jgi:hypothetical protein
MEDAALKQVKTDSLALRLFFEAMFQCLESASLRNKAYSEVIRKEANSVDLMTRVLETEDRFRALAEPLKYSDLLTQATRAVEGHSLAELVPLAHKVQERVQIWGKP